MPRHTSRLIRSSKGSNQSWSERAKVAANEHRGALMRADADVLVTGAGGFIGGHLVGDLLDRHLQVRAVDCKPHGQWYQLHDKAQNLQADLNDLSTARAVTAGTATVYHLAADMGGMGFIEN